MMTESYFRQIEDAFANHRGGERPLDVKEQALISKWNEKCIPLHIVLQGIERTFNTRGGRRTINSLEICQSEVETLFAKWIKAQWAAMQTVEGEERSSIDDTDLVKLLKIQFEHMKVLRRLLKAKVEINDIEVDVLGVVLDALNVPPDYVVENCEEHGSQICYEHPGAYSRDWLIERFEKMVKSGTDEECKSYLRWVAAKLLTPTKNNLE